MGTLSLLLAVGLAIVLTSNAKECCQTKIVGNEAYTYLESDPIETADAQCANSCVYEKDGVLGSRICFKAGTQSNICAADCKCGLALKDQPERVINGQPTNVTDFPWFLALTRLDRVTGKSSACGASLISKKWALTAAHCVSNNIFQYYSCNQTITTSMVANPSDVTLILELASLIQNVPTFREFINVDLISVPENFYDAVYGGNDIALLRLTKEVNVGEFPNVCLPMDPELFVNEDGVVIGYGLTKAGNPPSGTPEYLMKGNVDIVDNQICNNLMADSNLTVPADALCGGGGSSVCYGDSGGALMTKIKGTNQYELRGIPSFVTNGTCADDYAVYVNVFYHVEWILKTVEQYGGSGQICR